MCKQKMYADMCTGVCRVLLVLLEPLVLLDFKDLLVFPVLEEIVVPLVALVLWYVWTHHSEPLTEKSPGQRIRQWLCLCDRVSLVDLDLLVLLDPVVLLETLVCLV